mgnify:FL=1
MARYIKQGTPRDGLGNIIAGATVSVYLAGTTTVASVYAAYQALRQHAKEIATEVLP